MENRAAVEAVRHAALWFEPTRAGLRPLLDLIDDAHVVLIGEATRGTHEFTRIRTALTAALVADKHFNVVAAEADAAAVVRVDHWVRLVGLESGPHGALDDFAFPRWAWRNDVIARFAQWLRGDNARHAAADRVGIHGLGLPGDALMCDALEDAMLRTARHMGYARAVVWAHNRQAGDARATHVRGSTRASLGQRAREIYGSKTFLIGVTTHAGTVTAARSWNGAGERMQLPPSIAGSYEHLFHATGLERFVVSTSQAGGALGAPRFERMVGAVYQPQSRDRGEYVHASMAGQFDAVVHVDQTAALQSFDEPLSESDDRAKKHRNHA